MVEDPFVTRFVGALLGQHGYQALPVGARQAASVICAGESEFPLVLTNQPAEFLEYSGRVSLLYLAASPDPQLAAQFERCRVVRKPFQVFELIEALAELRAAVFA